MDYDEFFREYREYIVALLIKYDVPEAEDVSQELIIKLLERDFLSMYDPSRGIPLKGFLAATVRVYAQGYRERQYRNASRTMAVLDSPIKEGSDKTFGDLVVKATPSAEDEWLGELSEAEEVLDKVREHLKDKRISNKNIKHGHVTLADVLDMMLELIQEDRNGCIGRYGSVRNPIPVAEMAERFGVSSTAASRWATRALDEAKEFLNGVQ